ncbi:hypothetical protein HDU81_006903 [Chytriomyces hyalinus]|nr:hypothetical protein HDU81_006903 [Chytriomyces hyalinus]
MHLMSTALLPLLALLAHAQKPAAPASKPLTLGVWFWYTEHTPASWNTVMERKYPAFQADFNIPDRVSPDGNSVIFDMAENDPNFMKDPSKWNDQSDAAAFITDAKDVALANGTQGLDLVTDEALVHLGQRLAKIKREVYLRWCPEQNGNWMAYGPPTPGSYYVSVWKRMYTTVKQYAPSVKVVWSPNYDLPPKDTSTWPGPEFVDMVGTSVYFKGFGKNERMPIHYIDDSIGNIYNEYAVKYNKPFVISESSGAWESGTGTSDKTGEKLTIKSTVDQVTFQKLFWDRMLSTDFLDTYPLLEAVYLFDMAKQEEFFRDFRVSADPAVRNNFKAAIDALDAKGRMKWANDVAAVSSTTSAVTSAVETSVATSVATGVASVSSTKTSSGSSLSVNGWAAFCLCALVGLM